MTAVVIDTNVPVVANGGHSEAGPRCVLACLHSLQSARRQLVLVDDGQRIFEQYRRHLSHSGQPGAGDAFFKWLWDNQGYLSRCRMVRITPDGDSNTDFLEYPNDPALEQFDPSDRVFVAVAVASGINPEILNA